jgi:predicted acetyltransferase
MFEFHDPGQLIDGDLRLVLREVVPAEESLGYVPAYQFNMLITGNDQAVGGIALRVGKTEYLVKYAGQIGYWVNPAYRGHHYAARSCQLLLSLARHHDLNPLWITCNPDNYASRRTCELAGARLIEIVDLPENTDMYQEGERQKCRYRIDL